MSRQVLFGVIDGENLYSEKRVTFKDGREISVPGWFISDMGVNTVVLLLVNADASVDMRMRFDRQGNSLLLERIDSNRSDRICYDTINKIKWLDYIMSSIPDITDIAWDNIEMNLQPDLQGYQTIGGIPNVTVVGRIDNRRNH